jgi:hypothetical protein
MAEMMVVMTVEMMVGLKAVLMAARMVDEMVV